MHFKQGASVFEKNRIQVGHVERVVFDPKTREVDGVVVRKGILFTDDKVVPIGLVDQAAEGRVDLSISEEDVGRLPKFESVEYVTFEVNNQGENLETVPGEPHHGGLSSAPPYFYYPGVGAQPWATARWSGRGSEAHYVENIPEGDIALMKGALVVSNDKVNVGRLLELISHEKENRVSHFVLARGLINRDCVAIPSGWIKSLDEDTILLAVNADIVDALPTLPDLVVAN